MDQRQVLTLNEIWESNVSTRTRWTSKELSSIAEKELNEVPTERSDKIQAFREAVSCVSGLKSRTDDSFLLRFLRARKFDQKRAMDLLITYYKLRIKYPELHRNLLAASIPHVLAEPLYGALPHKDPQGRTILVLKPGVHWDPAIVSFDDLMRNMLITLERAIVEEEAQICGMVVLMDTRGFVFRHYLSCSPKKLAMSVSIFFHSLPIRFKEVHIINEDVFARWSFYILKPFLSQKIKERFIFHGTNLGSLHERYPPEILPEEFGGFLGPFSNAGWNKILLENDDLLEKDYVYGFNG